MPALGVHGNELNLSWSELQKQFPSKHPVPAFQNGVLSPASASCHQNQTNGNHNSFEDSDQTVVQKHSTPPRGPFDNSSNGNDTMNGITSTDTVNGNDFAAPVDRVPLDNESTRRTPAATGPSARPLHNEAGGTSAKRARHRTLVGSMDSQPCIIPLNLNDTDRHITHTPALNNQRTNGAMHHDTPDGDPVTGQPYLSGAEALPTSHTSPSRPEKAESNSETTLRKRQLNSSSGVLESMPTPPHSPSPYRHLLGDMSPFQTSYKGVSESAGAWGELGHYNILHVTTRDPGQHWFTRYCCYLVHCSRLKVNFPYPAIRNKAILEDDRIQAALDQAVCEGLAPQRSAADGSTATRDTSSQYRAMMAQQVARANSLLNNMKAAISTALIRLTGYVLFKVFSRLLTSVVVHKGQLEAIQRASKKGTPLIFVPLHRSHVDYLFVTWVLFNCQIPAPIVAAGDNLNIPVFGALLRATGGFFIKRRLESSKARRDVLYRALLQCYISHTLHAGYNLEFFIEGGRTRTGKAAMPKGGLLSVIVDAYLSGLLDDAMVVPIAINYDRLVDGNFIREQLGQSKVPESFWGAVCAICKVLSTNYGQSRIDFGAPFSLREFVQTSRIPVAQLQAVGGAALSSFSAPATRGHHRSLSTPVSAAHLNVRRVPSNPPTANTDCVTVATVREADAKMHPAMSNSSLFGTELTDEFRELVKKLGQHIVFDAERCQAMMSSNLVAWLCSFVYRDGATLTTLATALAELRAELNLRARDVGFTGDPEDVVRHAVRLLGPGLIQSEVVHGRDTIYRPVTILPNVIELNYYANALLPVFALDAIVATSVQSVLECDLWSYIDCDTNITMDLDKVMRRSVRLCELLVHEFVLVAPCGKLPAKLLDAVDRLQMSGLLTENKSCSRRNMTRHRRTDDDDMDSWLLPEDDEASAESDDSDSPVYTAVYSVTPSGDNLRHLAAHTAMLSPILDAYCATVQCVQQQLVASSMLEKELVSKTQNLVKEKLNNGIITYGESIAADPIKNCLKMLEGERVLQSSQQEGSRLLSLASPYDSTEAITALLDSVSVLRA